jgi:hypothetical protein
MCGVQFSAHPRPISNTERTVVILCSVNLAVTLLLLILQSFDWLAAFHLDLLQAILFIAVQLLAPVSVTLRGRIFEVLENKY